MARKSTPTNGTANLGFEAKLWLSADTFRRTLIEADLADCMVAVPSQLFYSTQIPVCLMFEVKRNALEASNDSGLFDGETELSLVA